MSYSTQFADANDNGFQQQVTIALMNMATTVATELNTVPNHAGRLVMLTNVFNNLTGYAFKYALVCVANGLTKTSTDAAVQTMVNTIWTDLSTASGSLI